MAQRPAYRVSWCDLDKFWLVIAPLGMIVYRTPKKHQAVAWIDRHVNIV